MTRSEVDVVQPDCGAAVQFIQQARRQLRSAGITGVDQESAYALSYQATVKALTGALIAIGRRVGSGGAAHKTLIDEARAHTGGDGAIFDRLDRMRRTRHAVFYDTSVVSRFEVESAMSDAAALIDHAARFVSARCKAD